MRNQDEDVSAPTELQLQNQFQCKKLHVTKCDRHQFLDVRQRVEDMYGLVHVLLVVSDSTAGHNGRTGLCLCPFQTQKLDMRLDKRSAGAWCAECDDVLGKRSSKTSRGTEESI